MVRASSWWIWKRVELGAEHGAVGLDDGGGEGGFAVEDGEGELNGVAGALRRVRGRAAS